MQEEWEVELHIRGILIFLEAEKKLMKDLSYFKLNLIMRDASVKKKRSTGQATVQRDVRKKSWTKISTNEAKTFGL